MDLATGAIGSIISKLAELLKDEYKLQTCIKDQVESLTKELKSAQAFLQDIDKVPPDQLDEQVRFYASEVWEASYDMEDVLDTFLVHVKGPEPIQKKQKKKLVKWLKEKIDGFFGKTVACHDIAVAIDDIKKHLQEVAECRGRYTIDNIVTRPSPSSIVGPRLAAMYKQVTQLIGIEKPRDELASLLSSNRKELKTVFVVGIGGLGKTTLTKELYDNHKVQFNCWAFVPVGRNPNLKKVLRDILIELDKNKYTDSKFTTLDIRQLIDELRVFLKKKRYFIVIDDVWDIASWETINLALVENNNGSRIIITTRNSDVATGEVYRLLPLSDDNSKRLLYTRIFGGEEKCHDNQRPKVSKVADKILKKCGGVPLAIITMASYLVGKSIEEWFEMCNSIGFCGKDKEQTGDTEWILSLTYYDLPSHLKTCLLYLSVFPEDYLIRKDDLIWMWIGEGFVNQKPGIGLFQIGEGYFNDLINRSLIQPVEEEESKIVEGCRVHDMILDLICSLSRKANFAIVSDNNGEDTILGGNAHARRLALQNRVVEDTPQDYHIDDKARARSLTAFRCHFGSRVPLRGFKLLRMLLLEDCGPVNFDEHNVGDLHHLRYLGIHKAYGCDLPERLEGLKFLQILDVDINVMSISSAYTLPSSVGMLTQLVCLCALRMGLPSELIKNLTSLQELEIDSVKFGMGQFVKDLGNLCELRVLIIIDLFIEEKMKPDFFKSLGNLHKLIRLQLRYNCGMFYKFVAASWNKGLAQLPRGLCQLDINILNLNDSYVLLACIDPSRLPNLSHLTLRMDSIHDWDLKILGGLPELCYLNLCILRDHGATLTSSTAAHVYFQKLRSCLLPHSMVHFVVNKEDSSVSFCCNSGPSTFGSKKEQNDNRAVARAIMPNLEALSFHVNLSDLTSRKNGSCCDNLGLECLATLQKVTVHMDYCSDAPDDVVEQEQAALRHAIQVHPHRPILQIKTVYAVLS